MHSIHDSGYKKLFSNTELIRDAHLLGKYAPQFEYFKIVEHDYPKEELLKIRNIVSTLFLTESYYDFEVVKHEFLSLFQRERDRQAVSLLLNWFRQLAEHQRIDPSDYQELERVYHTVEEVRTMLITALERERKQIRQEGRQEGREEGLQEGRQEGINKGELIGEIRLAQKFLKRPVMPIEVLAQKDLKMLKSLFQELEAELTRFN